MAQCKKTLDSGERCSNQAVPGTDYCQTHQERIIFRPTTKPADSPPPPPASAAPKPVPSPPAGIKPKPTAKPKPLADRVLASTPDVKPPSWKATPSATGQKPSFPGLRADERNILVAPQAAIWLASEPDSTPASQFTRLVRLLGFLSQALDLPGHIRLLRQGEVSDYLVQLSPAQPDDPNLSALYDSAAAAARLVDSQLYIGQDNAFVQYRDDGAPRGYDVPKIKLTGSSGQLLLVANGGSRQLVLSNFTEIPLTDLCMQVAPVLDPTTQRYETVYVLTPPPLYPLLAKYFRAHHLRYSLARLQAPGGELFLFEISPRSNALAGQSVPAFILDYLSRLPRVALLVIADQADNRSILLQWKHRYPLHLPNIVRSFEPQDMVLLMAYPFPNLRIHPAPEFFDGDLLVDVHTPGFLARNLAPAPTKNTSKLRLEILLRPDNGPTPPIAAVLLSAQELAWLRQLLYRLPIETFGTYMLYQGDDGAVLVGSSRPIEGLPFGMPLRRLGDTELFIPLRSRLMPDVSWSVLREALAIKENTYTFLTHEQRIDLPAAHFAPLSRVLVADSARPRVKFNLRAASKLPDLHWTAPPAPAIRPHKEDDKSFLRGLLTGRSQPAEPREAGTKLAAATKIDEDAHWRERARAYEEAQDFLSAAMCYSLLNDQSSSARCYRRAAAELQTKSFEEQ